METSGSKEGPRVAAEQIIETIDLDEVLDHYVKPADEFVKLWDERIRKRIFFDLMYQKRWTLNKCLREYIKSLEDLDIFTDISLLKEKIYAHIELIHTSYFCEKCLRIVETSVFLDNMVEILTYYCNLELRCAKQLKVRRNSNRNNSAVIKEKRSAVTKHICTVLTLYLMNSQKHIYHVLIKLNCDINSKSCKRIFAEVCWHYLAVLPEKDLSQEGFCRYYLVLQKFKKVLTKEEQELMDKIMEEKFSQLSVSFEEVLSNIFFPNNLNTVVLYSLFKDEIEYYVKAYFDYIKKKEINDDVNLDGLEDDPIPVIEVDDDNENTKGAISDDDVQIVTVDCTNESDDDVEFVSEEKPNSSKPAEADLSGKLQPSIKMDSAVDKKSTVVNSALQNLILNSPWFSQKPDINCITKGSGSGLHNGIRLRGILPPLSNDNRSIQLAAKKPTSDDEEGSSNILFSSSGPLVETQSKAVTNIAENVTSLPQLTQEHSVSDHSESDITSHQNAEVTSTTSETQLVIRMEEGPSEIENSIHTKSEDVHTYARELQDLLNEGESRNAEQNLDVCSPKEVITEQPIKNVKVENSSRKDTHEQENFNTPEVPDSEQGPNEETTDKEYEKTTVSPEADSNSALPSIAMEHEASDVTNIPQEEMSPETCVENRLNNLKTIEDGHLVIGASENELVAGDKLAHQKYISHIETEQYHINDTSDTAAVKQKSYNQKQFDEFVKQIAKKDLLQQAVEGIIDQNEINGFSGNEKDHCSLEGNVETQEFDVSNGVLKGKNNSINARPYTQIFSSTKNGNYISNDADSAPLVGFENVTPKYSEDQNSSSYIQKENLHLNSKKARKVTICDSETKPKRVKTSTYEYPADSLQIYHASLKAYDIKKEQLNRNATLVLARFSPDDCINSRLIFEEKQIRSQKRRHRKKSGSKDLDNDNGSSYTEEIEKFKQRHQGTNIVSVLRFKEEDKQGRIDNTYNNQSSFKDENCEAVPVYIDKCVKPNDTFLPNKVPTLNVTPSVEPYLSYSDMEFSNSPKFLQDADRTLADCLIEKDSAGDNLQLPSFHPFLSDNSNFYESQNSISSNCHCDEETEKLNEMQEPQKKETCLPFKKRRMSVSHQKNLKEATEEISYPAKKMICIAEIEAIEKSQLSSRTFKTPAERKEMPPLPMYNNINTNPEPILTDQYHINNHTFNDTTINYHMSNVPVPLINLPYFPVLLPFNNIEAYNSLASSCQELQEIPKEEVVKSSKKQGSTK